MPQTQSPVAKARLLVKCSATATTDGTYLWKIFYLCQYCHIFIISIYKAGLTWDQTQGPQEDCTWWAGLRGPAQSWKPHKVQFFVKHKMLLTNLAARSPALARSAPTMATGRGPRATTTLAEITPDTHVTATWDILWKLPRSDSHTRIEGENISHIVAFWSQNFLLSGQISRVLVVSGSIYFSRKKKFSVHVNILGLITLLV